jgi:hypothetical protein
VPIARTLSQPTDGGTLTNGHPQHRGMSLNKLFEEFSAASLAERDAETRFRLLAAQGDPTKGIAVLDKLDEEFQTR